jgi:1-aminocyclopropane-1-carboxylate deaminase
MPAEPLQPVVPLGSGSALQPVVPLALRLPSPLDELRDDRLAAAGIRLYLKRDDLISADITGNKWRKLKYNLVAARSQGHDTLLTFGGAYSSHIRAVAAAGRHFGFASIGVIRGERHLPLNDSLRYAADCGMRLTYLDRTAYRLKDSTAVTERLAAEYGSFYLLPEGGSNALAVRGCAEIAAEVASAMAEPFDLICCPCGTGGTLAGLAAGLRPGQQALGFAVLKGAGFLDRQVKGLQQEALGAATTNWSISHEFHCGGYARRPAELTDFIADFERRHGMALDWVYVAKMLRGIFLLAQEQAIRPGTTAVALITGPAR